MCSNFEMLPFVLNFGVPFELLCFNRFVESMPILRKSRKRGDDEESTEQKSKKCASVVKGKEGNIKTYSCDENDDKERTEQKSKQRANVVKGKERVVTTHSCDESENDDKESNEQRSKQCADDVMGNQEGNVTTHSCDESENDSINLGSNNSKTRRGPTQLERLQKQRVQGIKKDVMFNKHCQPIGKAGAQLQSYVGVLAREKVKISYKSWKQVPRDVKELIWVTVNVSELPSL